MRAQTAGKAKPWNLSRPRSLQFDYTGGADSILALKSGAARPLSLGAADFRKNGATDLVAGYGSGTHGLLAVYQDATGALPVAARVFETPEAPDFLLAGDFNRDGNADLLIAARRGGLYFLAGDAIVPCTIPAAGSWLYAGWAA